MYCRWDLSMGCERQPKAGFSRFHAYAPIDRKQERKSRGTRFSGITVIY
jgi:hypothetical protein